MHRTKRFALAGIIGLVAALVAVMVVTAGAKPDAGTADTDVVFANPDDSNTTTLVIQYYGIDGSAGPMINDSIGPLQAAVYLADDAGFSGAFQGVGEVSSDRQLGGVVTIGWAGGETADGIKKGQYSAVEALSDVIYFPNVVYDTDGSVGVQNTTMSVQNVGADEVTAYVRWTNLGGEADCNYTISVPGRGAVVMDTSEGPSDPSVCDTESTGFWGVWNFWSGGVTVTSTEQVLAGAAHVTWRQWAVGYRAVSSGATKVFFPSVERREYEIVDNGRFGGGSSRWGGLSTVAVTNLDQSNPTSATFTFVDSLGIVENKVFTLPLAAGGTVRMNTHSGAKIGDTWYYVHDDLKVLDRYPEDDETREWVGSVIVESTEGTPILGSVNNLFIEYNKANLYEGWPDGGGYTAAVVPDIYRVSGGDFSLLRIQNLSADTATINAHFYDRAGNDLLQFVDYELDGFGVATPNLNRGCFGDGTTDCTKDWELSVAGDGLGTNFMGWILLTSDEPIAVTVENWFGGTSHAAMGAYNGTEYTSP